MPVHRLDEALLHQIEIWLGGAGAGCTALGAPRRFPRGGLPGRMVVRVRRPMVAVWHGPAPSITDWPVDDRLVGAELAGLHHRAERIDDHAHREQRGYL